MTIIKQYAIPIIGVQFVSLLLLGYLLYGSYSQWEEETKVERDTVQTVKRDTAWVERDSTWYFSDPIPTDTVTRTRIDTTVRRDTVYITERPGTKIYRQDFSSSLASGIVSSTVRGTLLNQTVEVSSTIPKITVDSKMRVNTTVTKTQIGKWRPVASLDTYFSRDGIEVIAPGIGLQRPTELSISYKYDVLNGYHGASVNLPLSLIF